MTASKIEAPVPRFALVLPEAAASLGMSPSSFTRYVKPHVRMIRRGKLVLVPVQELEAWVAANAEHVLDTADRRGA